MRKEELHDKSIYFMFSYRPLMNASQFCNDNWGYGLINYEGKLLKLFSTDAFIMKCADRGIKQGVSFVDSLLSGTAISKGLQSSKYGVTQKNENKPVSLKDCTIAFSPINLNVSGLQDAPAYVRPYTEKTENVGQYGGVAVFSFADHCMQGTLAIADAIADQIMIQLHWFNLNFQDYTSDTCFISIAISEGKNQIAIATSNTWEIFKIPEEVILFRAPLESLFDPLPANEILWDLVNSQRMVNDYVSTLQKDGKLYDVSITTRRSADAKVFRGEFVIIIQSLLKINKIREQYIGTSSAYFTFENIIHGGSKRFSNVLNLAHTAAKTMANVLLQGESGTGKDVLAQAIHNESLRSEYPFVAINCASLSRELIASELFGYEAGAFTGAKKNGAIGKFEMAKHGTLFLDEIGDMPLDLQVMLLRVIEERRFMKVGGTTEIEADIRIIAATNKDLHHMIEQKLFRKDLFYRLGVVQMTIPPLRERIEDILPLANYYLNTICTRQSKPIVFLSEAAKNLLINYPWPGNVRELRNMLEGIISTQDCSQVNVDMILKYSELSGNAFGCEETHTSIAPYEGEDETCERKQLLLRRSANVTKQSILDTLADVNNDLNKAAELLGISKRTLYRRLHKYGLMG